MKWLGETARQCTKAMITTEIQQRTEKGTIRHESRQVPAASQCCNGSFTSILKKAGSLKASGLYESP
jgi:hypothetical protein